MLSVSNSHANTSAADISSNAPETYDATFELRESILSDIHVMFQARLEYNKELCRFIKSATLAELKHYYSTLLKKTVSLKEEDLEGFKKDILKGFEDECLVYHKINFLIDQEPHAQEMIDKLHCFLYREYNTKINMVNISMRHIKKKQQSHFENQLLETTFYNKAMKSLGKIISNTERRFCEYVRYVDVAHTATDNILRIDHAKFSEENGYLHKCREAVKKLLLLITNIQLQSLDGSQKYQDLIDSEILNDTQLIGYSLRLANINPNTLDDENIWKTFHEVDKIYRVTVKTLKQVEDYIRSTTSPAELREAEETQKAQEIQKAKELQAKKASFLPVEPPKKAVPKKKLEKSKTQKSQTAPTPSATKTVDKQVEPNKTTTLKSKDETQSKIQERGNILEQFKERAEAYKQEVIVKRAEKARQKQARRAAEMACLEKTRALQLKKEKNKEKVALKNTFKLLSVLNPNNLVLIQRIFETPTPHGQISYKKIENLFGAEAEGKLPGKIEAHGGSHRQITLQGVCGFFDAIEVMNTESTPAANSSNKVVGGMFKAHKEGHIGKLPSMAINLLRSTLERAGMSAINIKRFCETKDCLLQKGMHKPNFEELCSSVKEENKAKFKNI